MDRLILLSEPLAFRLKALLFLDLPEDVVFLAHDLILLDHRYRSPA